MGSTHTVSTETMRETRGMTNTRIEYPFLRLHVCRCQAPPCRGKLRIVGCRPLLWQCMQKEMKQTSGTTCTHGTERQTGSSATGSMEICSRLQQTPRRHCRKGYLHQDTEVVGALSEQRLSALNTLLTAACDSIIAREELALEGHSFRLRPIAKKNVNASDRAKPLKCKRNLAKPHKMNGAKPRKMNRAKPPLTIT